VATCDEQRGLSGIFAPDRVGYSRLIGEHETGTFGALRLDCRERLTAKIIAPGGRIVKLSGMYALPEFANAIEAVACGVRRRSFTSRSRARR
jgi:hypothetical protein